MVGGKPNVNPGQTKVNQEQRTQGPQQNGAAPNGEGKKKEEQQNINPMMFNIFYNFLSNYMCNMRNFTQKTLYGVLYNGSVFNLMPECYAVAGNGIMISSSVKSYQNMYDPTAGYNTLEQKWINSVPIEGFPLYIEQLNCVLFASAEERARAIDKFRDGERLVKAYAAGIVPLVNACYVATQCLNRNRNYCTIINGTIQHIPSVRDEDYESTIARYGISKEQLEANEVFIVDTIVRNTSNDINKRENTLYTYVKRINKDDILEGEPIIFEENGMLIFKDEHEAGEFIKRFGTVANYLIEKALDVTDKTHRDEIKELNEMARDDKRSMAETYGIISGSSILTLVTDNLIKSYRDEGADGEGTKAALKTLAVALCCIGGVIGIYQGYRYFKKKRKARNAEFEG